MEVTTKPFFSVFPDLKVSDDVRSLFEDANIKEITLKKRENMLKTVSYTHLDVYKRQLLMVYTIVIQLSMKML